MPDGTIRAITGHTELLGLIAYPIRHSMSPRMHNLALAELDLDYAYLAFEVDTDQLADAVTGLRALRVRGWNVSMPNKMAILPLLDDLSPAARMVGAVNTVVNDDGHLTGHVTDGIGYMTALREAGIDPAGRRITMIGAGGAGTAIAIQAALDGVERIDIFNRRDAVWPVAEHTVQTIAEQTSATAVLHDLDDIEDFRACVAASSVLANATNVGMGTLKDLSPLPDPEVLRPDLFVSDVVYSPARTLFLAQAEAAGCRTMNGLGMMLHQGAAAFELWTGTPMPLNQIRAELFGEPQED
ncbi:shikimate dehydrogenase [Cellulomonas denverensis]|uniref:Shikimate dehydrogenase (NADP(+)) n=1 Tax=Cellulomonas denverensis TaxID=264297 RepID=A0A7X6KWQ8_9CELL|nr:shikimate dehydrogenase [Cellulomonas denverensis]NKY23661.1 shikimate dehydrogenase [Cellulomonas denverensis]GIG26858.1 shikimate dehydrogenase (NADP(+)) [Cellulomonas denverensis]